MKREGKAKESNQVKHKIKSCIRQLNLERYIQFYPLLTDDLLSKKGAKLEILCEIK